MKRKIVAILACVAALSVLLYYFGPQRRVLENASEFTLYSLQPQADLYSGIYRDPKAFRKSKEKFHRYVVLGKTKITDAKIQADLVAALYRGIEESQGFASACFEPRHAIRVKSGLRTVDVVICFQCMQVLFYEWGRSRQVLLTDSPQPVFDKILKQAKVPLGLRPQH